MDLRVTPEYEEYRRQVRSFLERRHDRSSRPDGKRLAAFLRAAIDAGYAWRHVPREYGGAGRPFDPLEAMIIQEEFSRVRAPAGPPGTGRLVIPALLAHGTEAQKQRFIPPTLVGELIWCQGFSEPGAGSDLASVSTRATLDGDRWVINGQKIWTSHAHIADYIFALVRTEPDAPEASRDLLPADRHEAARRRGPAAAADDGRGGLQRGLSERRHGPAGPDDRGARGGLGRQERDALVERVGNAGSPSVALFERVLKLARGATRHGRPALEDPEVRQWLAGLEAMALAHLTRAPHLHPGAATARTRAFFR